MEEGGRTKKFEEGGMRREKERREGRERQREDGGDRQMMHQFLLFLVSGDLAHWRRTPMECKAHKRVGLMNASFEGSI